MDQQVEKLKWEAPEVTVFALSEAEGIGTNNQEGDSSNS